MSKNEGIHSSSGKFHFEFSPAMIRDFCFRGWCVLFPVLSNPVEDLLFPILEEVGMLSSLPGLVEPMRQGRLHTGPWVVESSPQRIDGDWYIVTRFGNILHIFYLMTPKFESSEIRVPSQEFADCAREAKLFAAW
jgi:hypothetical protein